MNYHQPELLEHLASSYALGTLRGAARRRFDKLLRTDAVAQEQLAFWEQRLGELAELLPSRTPPPAAWAAISASTLPTPPAPRLARRSYAPGTPDRAHQRRHWRAFAAGFGVAASLVLVVLALLLGQQHPLRPVTPPPSKGFVATSASSDSTEALPMVVARLQMPTSSMGWLVSITPDHQRLTAVAGQDFLPLGRRSIQLWLLSPGKEPIALGLLPSNADTEESFALPSHFDDPSQISLGISLEPPGGSPNGKLNRSLLGSSTGI